MVVWCNIRHSNRPSCLWSIHRSTSFWFWKKAASINQRRIIKWKFIFNYIWKLSKLYSSNKEPSKILQTLLEKLRYSFFNIGRSEDFKTIPLKRLIRWSRNNGYKINYSKRKIFKKVLNKISQLRWSEWLLILPRFGKIVISIRIDVNFYSASWVLSNTWEKTSSSNALPSGTLVSKSIIGWGVSFDNRSWTASPAHFASTSELG